MRRRYLNQAKLKDYVFEFDRLGNPDVYINGKHIGKAAGNKLSFKHTEIAAGTPIVLSGYSLPNPYNYALINTSYNKRQVDDRQFYVEIVLDSYDTYAASFEIGTYQINANTFNYKFSPEENTTKTGSDSYVRFVNDQQVSTSNGGITEYINLDVGSYDLSIDTFSTQMDGYINVTSDRWWDLYVYANNVGIRLDMRLFSGLRLLFHFSESEGYLFDNKIIM